MKQERVKIIFFGILLISIFFFFFIHITNNQYEAYKKSANTFVYGIVKIVQEQYPDISEKSIMELLNTTENISYLETFKKYGIKKEDSILYSLEKNHQYHLRSNLFFLLGSFVFLFILFFIYFFRKEQKIKEITNYLKEINRKNYKLGIKNNEEGELSILRNEVYKITVMLREESEFLKKEKRLLKDSISDISHQLKTPLTSISIMLDNILDNPSMEEETKKEFITNVYHQVEHIRFLLIAMLKLARMDADVVTFKKEKIDVFKLFQDVLKNVSVLCELQEVEIKISNFKDISFLGDYHWELEAMTNLIKNAIEHSNKKSVIEILATENRFYLKIIIKDYGEGIKEEDLRHIFTRFYKGNDSNFDSIGIGLSLAKKIIEKDNGYILVHSKIGIGTTFEIKFMK